MMDDFSFLFLLLFLRLFLFLILGVSNNAHDKSVVCCAVASAMDESLVNVGDGGIDVGDDDDDVMLTLSDNNIRRMRYCGKLLLLLQLLVLLIMADVVEANWFGGMDDGGRARCHCHY